MKKFKTFIGKILIPLLTFILMLVVGGMLISLRGVSDIPTHKELMNENSELKLVNDELLTKLTEMESFVMEIKEYDNVLNNYPTISPISTEQIIRVSSRYGYRIHPIRNVISFHNGIDLTGLPNTPIHSTAQGEVIEVSLSNTGFGNVVVIKHGYGFKTVYAHLNDINVVEGQWVAKNQIIGSMGNSGLSTGFHLHYEIHMNNVPINPEIYFIFDNDNKLLVVN